jgi:hypothetical protein
MQCTRTSPVAGCSWSAGALRIAGITVDTPLVSIAVFQPPGWWNWRISARCRLASLASAWVIVLGASVLGPLFWPLACARFVASIAQTGLNVSLGRVRPIGSATRLDKWLVAGVFAGAYLGAGLGRVTGDMTSPGLLLPMLLPFSMLQLRMTRRALRLDGEQVAEDGMQPRPRPITAIAREERLAA